MKIVLMTAALFSISAYAGAESNSSYSPLRADEYTNPEVTEAIRYLMSLSAEERKEAIDASPDSVAKVAAEVAKAYALEKAVRAVDRVVEHVREMDRRNREVERAKEYMERRGSNLVASPPEMVEIPESTFDLPKD